MERSGGVDFSEDETRKILGRLAAAYFLEERRVISYERDIFDRMSDGRSDRFLQFALRMNLLRSESNYNLFQHLRLRDYFAIEALVFAFEHPMQWLTLWPLRKQIGDGARDDGFPPRVRWWLPWGRIRERFRVHDAIRARAARGLHRIGSLALPALEALASRAREASGALTSRKFRSSSAYLWARFEAEDPDESQVQRVLRDIAEDKLVAELAAEARSEHPTSRLLDLIKEAETQQVYRAIYTLEAFLKKPASARSIDARTAAQAALVTLHEGHDRMQEKITRILLERRK
jgi:hypothetical protein